MSPVQVLQMSPVQVLQMSPVHVLQMSPVHVLQMSPVQVLQVQSSPGFTTCHRKRCFRASQYQSKSSLRLAIHECLLI